MFWRTRLQKADDLFSSSFSSKIFCVCVFPSFFFFFFLKSDNQCAIENVYKCKFFNLHLLIQKFPSNISITATTAPLVWTFVSKTDNWSRSGFLSWSVLQVFFFFLILSAVTLIMYASKFTKRIYLLWNEQILHN